MKKIIYKLFDIFILIPLSLLWEYVYRIKRILYDCGIVKQYVFEIPIISVGNITFGGTGKTPFIIWLSKHLYSKGLKVLILTRGYGGNKEKSYGVLKDGRYLVLNPNEYGDEALLLVRKSKNATIIIGKNRCQNLEFFFEKEQPDVVLLDDGFQYLKLFRNLNIIMFDSTMELDKYKVAPKGYMREGLSSLNSANIIVLNRVNQISSEKKKDIINIINKYIVENIPIIEINQVPTGLFDTNFNKVLDMTSLDSQKVICLSGIASPLPFFDMIESCNASIIDKVTYPDHYNYKSEDINELEKKATKNDAVIITTEKDMVKIRRFTISRRFLYIDIELEFVSGINRISKILDNTVKSGINDNK